jgi:hypothetical protein
VLKDDIFSLAGPPGGRARGGRRTPAGARALGLLFDREPGIGQPGSDLLQARIVMMAAVGPVPDDLAVHHRKPDLRGFAPL